MKKYIIISSIILSAASQVQAQSYPHYTMFMFNKMMYNPAYAGNKDMTTANLYYRKQWTGIKGAPQTMTATVDGPVGSYMKAFRPVALGLSVTNETAGITSNTSFMGYYAYRINMQRSVLSMGIQAGVTSYTANYSQANPYDAGDRVLTQDIKNALLPNVGAGVYWSGQRFYVSAAVPNLLQNYYDKDHKIDSRSSRQTRSYYVGGGYIFPLGDNVKLEPQVLARYAGNSVFDMPFNADANLSVILYDRLLIGATYRTDRSLEGLVHMQVTKNINIGYSYDYTLSGLNPYNDGSHEVTLGFDFIKDKNKYTNPRFIKLF